MITTEQNIIIVPDYGIGAGNEIVVALKEACDALRLDGRIVSFPETMGHKDNMSERQLIESSAKELTSICSRASLLVVFGKSAMLTDASAPIPILYINPEYDSEWPWKHLYYAYRKQTLDLEYTDVTKRYGVFTTKEALRHGASEFSDRYARSVVYEPETGLGPDKLAQLIYRVAEGFFSFPLDEIYEEIRRFPRETSRTDDMCNSSGPVKIETPIKFSEYYICRFLKPVQLEDFTVLGITPGVPMVNGQSGLKLKVAELDYNLPLERYIDRKSLNALRDAIVKSRMSIEGPAAKVSEVLRDIKPKSHYVTFTMPGIEREYDREFTIEPAQLRDAMLRKVLLGSGRRGTDSIRGLETRSFNLQDELRDGIAEIIHSDYPEFAPEDIKHGAEITYGETELACYLDNLALFIRLVLDGRIPQRHVAKCFERYFDVDLYEDGPDFDKWYGTNFNRLLG